jgi:16S rRNA (cytidine1402-2'-O)-methyltransferase
MSGTLFIVPTPIGNLEDVTLRALRVLGEADLIAAEDTRRTARLLQHYSISTPTTSLHEHNERRKVPTLLQRLADGASVALVSDAGTPGISDPGLTLVQAAWKAGIQVQALPGPSAVLAALVVSGLPADSFLFVGFPPSRATARERWLSDLRQENRTLVLFEAPHRIVATLRQAMALWGDREVLLARELTKRHEELVKGPISAVLQRLGEPRGEITLVVSGAVDPHLTRPPFPGDEALATELGQIAKQFGLDRRAALARLASKYDLPVNEAYRAIERAKQSAE